MMRTLQTFLACILLHMLLPLLPVGLQAWFTGSVDAKALTLAASMYCIALGISSRNGAFFALTLVLSLGYALMFGMLGALQPPPHLRGFVAWSLVAVFAWHAVERWGRHVVDRAPFLEF